jgi:hypothetical protein
MNPATGKPNSIAWKILRGSYGATLPRVASDAYARFGIKPSSLIEGA